MLEVAFLTKWKTSVFYLFQSYTGDTRPNNSIKQQGRNADILIHDSTFGDKEGELAKKRGILPHRKLERSQQLLM